MKLRFIPNIKRVYYLMYVANILGSILYLFNNSFLNNFDIDSIVILVLGIVFYGVILFYFFKRRNKIYKIDLVLMWVYLFLIISYFITSIIYQINYFNTYNMLYFKNFLIGPHVIFLINGLIGKKSKKGSI